MASAPHIDTPEQAAVRAKRGFICNWTKGHCPSGCANPCVFKIDHTRSGGEVETIDLNPGYIERSAEAS